MQENSVNEVRILESVNHPNEIGYKEAFWNDKESSLIIFFQIEGLKVIGTYFSKKLRKYSYGICR